MSSVTSTQNSPPSRLGSVRAGTIQVASRFLIYGPSGVGKTTLAADAPSPIFLDIEGGSDAIDVPRYTFRDDDHGYVPLAFSEVLAAIDDLLTATHTYKTLVIDTVDAIEVLVHAHICKEHGKKNIEDFGYGKGYQIALDTYRVLLARLDRVRMRGITIILLGHSVLKMFKNPTGEDYDRYQLRVHDKAAGQIKEWCDVVGFLRFDEFAGKLEGDRSKRTRGISTGRRIMALQRDAAWDAKSRLALPAEVEIDAQNPWAPFGVALGATADALRAEIDAELVRLGNGAIKTATKETTAERIRVGCASADKTQLLRTLNALKELS